MSIDGLASGLDTTSLIKSLMQLERLPQVRLQTERSELVRTNSYYQEINRQFSAIDTAAKAITGVNGWNAAKATSSSAANVAVTAGASAQAGSLSFAVNQLARAGSVISGGSVADPSAVVIDPATTPEIHLVKGDAEAVAISVGDGKLSTIAANINAAKAGVTATVVNVGDTDGDGAAEHRLQLVSTTTGANSNISVRDTAAPGGADPFVAGLGGLDPLATGADAILKVGGATGYEIHRSSNTFSDVLPGVTFTLAKEDPATTVTVTVEQNTGAIADRVSKMVDAVNAALTGMAKQQAYDPTSKTGGPLMGDSLVQRLRTALVRSSSDAVAGTDLGIPSKAGITVERDGTLKFDRDVFMKAYEADPAAVQAVLGADTGVAGRLQALAASTKEQVDAGIKARTDRLPTIDNRIASWDRRLEVREQTLKKQFQAMEVALGQLNSQSSWLAGQINALNVNSGGN